MKKIDKLIFIILISVVQLGICGTMTAKQELYELTDRAERRQLTSVDFAKTYAFLQDAERAHVDDENIGYTYRVLGDNMSEVGSLEEAARAYADAYRINKANDEAFIAFLESRLKAKQPYTFENILTALKIRDPKRYTDTKLESPEEKH